MPRSGRPIVVVTTFFPNSADPHRAVFVRNLVQAQRRLRPVTVLSPVPWAPPLARWRAQRAIAPVETVDGMPVEHPRFPLVPRLGLLAGAGYALGIWRRLRRIRSEQGRVIVHAHCAYPDGVGVALAARALGLPYVVTAHGSDLNVYAGQPGLARQIGWALAHAAAVVAVSRGLQQKALALAGGSSGGSAGSSSGPLSGGTAGHVHNIPCAAVDPALFRPRSRDAARQALGLAAASPRGRIVLFIGQLVPIKGLDLLLDAWTRLAGSGRLAPGDQLVVIGEGPQLPALRAGYAIAADAARVRFAGAMAQAQLPGWIAAADLLCVPSRNEGTPNVVIEALACGIAVVASRVGGLPDLIEPDVNGLLVPAQDPAALADALAAAMARDWPAATVAATVAQFTWDAIAARNQAVYNAIEAAPEPA